MPVYWFEDDSGDLLEREFRMADCPSQIEENGRTYRKILAPVAFAMPDIHRADYWNEGRRKAQFVNNEITAKKVAAGEAYTLPSDQPREFRTDFENRVKKHQGRTS